MDITSYDQVKLSTSHIPLDYFRHGPPQNSQSSQGNGLYAVKAVLAAVRDEIINAHPDQRDILPDPITPEIAESYNWAVSLLRLINSY